MSNEPVIYWLIIPFRSKKLAEATYKATKSKIKDIELRDTKP